MTSTELKDRTRLLAVRLLRLTEAIPRGRAADVIARQLLRAGTSVAANYRAACRARSRSEFIAKLGIVEKEADETVFWLELAVDAHLGQPAGMQELLKEANDVTAIIVASIRTARSRGKMRSKAR